MKIRSYAISILAFLAPIVFSSGLVDVNRSSPRTIRGSDFSFTGMSVRSEATKCKVTSSALSSSLKFSPNCDELICPTAFTLDAVYKLDKLTNATTLVSSSQQNETSLSQILSKLSNNLVLTRSPFCDSSDACYLALCSNKNNVPIKPKHDKVYDLLVSSGVLQYAFTEETASTTNSNTTLHSSCIPCASGYYNELGTSSQCIPCPKSIDQVTNSSMQCSLCNVTEPVVRKRSVPVQKANKTIPVVHPVVHPVVCPSTTSCSGNCTSIDDCDLCSNGYFSPSGKECFANEKLATFSPEIQGGVCGNNSIILPWQWTKGEWRNVNLSLSNLTEFTSLYYESLINACKESVMPSLRFVCTDDNIFGRHVKKVDHIGYDKLINGSKTCSYPFIKTPYNLYGFTSVQENVNGNVLAVSFKPTPGIYYPPSSNNTLKEAKPCPIGHWCPGGTLPIKCPLGYHDSKTGATTSEICNECPEGSVLYIDDSSNGYCRVCDNGSIYQDGECVELLSCDSFVPQLANNNVSSPSFNDSIIHGIYYDSSSNEWVNASNLNAQEWLKLYIDNTIDLCMKIANQNRDYCASQLFYSKADPSDYISKASFGYYFIANVPSLGNELQAGENCINTVSSYMIPSPANQYYNPWYGYETCPNGYACISGLSNIECPSGYTSSVGSCLPCNTASYFVPGSGGSPNVCNSCPAGYVSPAGSESIDQCYLCNNGTYYAYVNYNRYPSCVTFGSQNYFNPIISNPAYSSNEDPYITGSYYYDIDSKKWINDTRLSITEWTEAYINNSIKLCMEATNSTYLMCAQLVYGYSYSYGQQAYSVPLISNFVSIQDNYSYFKSPLTTLGNKLIGKYNSSILPSPPGYYYNESFDLVECPGGSVCPGGLPPLECSPGFYTNGTGNTKCKMCEPGYTSYGNQSSVKSCIPCPSGEYISYGQCNQAYSNSSIVPYLVSYNSSKEVIPQHVYYPIFYNTTAASWDHREPLLLDEWVTLYINNSISLCRNVSGLSIDECREKMTKNAYKLDDYVGKNSQFMFPLKPVPLFNNSQIPTSTTQDITPDQHVVLAPEGYIFNNTNNQTIACPSGYACPGGIGAIPCSSMYHQPNEKAVTCLQCQQNEYSTLDYNTDKLHCVSCPAGSHSASGSWRIGQCSLCDQGTLYQDGVCTPYHSHSSFIPNLVNYHMTYSNVSALVMDAPVFSHETYTWVTISNIPLNIWFDYYVGNATALCVENTHQSEEFCLKTFLNNKVSEDNYLTTNDHGVYFISLIPTFGNPTNSHYDRSDPSSFIFNSTPAGYYYNGLSETSSGVLEPCPAGYACPGGIGAIKCPDNMINSLTGQTHCGKCPKGTWALETNKSSDEGCQSCPVGSYCLGDTHMPTACNNGYYCPEVGMKSPLKCPKNTYTPNSYSFDQILYKNLYTLPQNSFGWSKCLNIPDGTYLNNLTNSLGEVSEIISPCLSNTYSNSSTDFKCIECPEGYFAASNHSFCENCMYYEECADSVLDTLATFCPCGQYYNGTSCVNAPPGYYVPSPRCSCQGTPRKPLPCPIGFYTSQNASSYCLPCAAGSCKSLGSKSYADTFVIENSISKGVLMPKSGSHEIKKTIKFDNYYHRRVKATAEFVRRNPTYNLTESDYRFGYGHIAVHDSHKVNDVLIINNSPHQLLTEYHHSPESGVRRFAYTTDVPANALFESYNAKGVFTKDVTSIKYGDDHVQCLEDFIDKIDNVTEKSKLNGSNVFDHTFDNSNSAILSENTSYTGSLYNDSNIHVKYEDISQLIHNIENSKKSDLCVLIGITHSYIVTFEFSFEFGVSKYATAKQNGVLDIFTALPGNIDYHEPVTITVNQISAEEAMHLEILPNINLTIAPYMNIGIESLLVMSDLPDQYVSNRTNSYVYQTYVDLYSNDAIQSARVDALNYELEMPVGVALNNYSLNISQNIGVVGNINLFHNDDSSIVLSSLTLDSVSEIASNLNVLCAYNESIPLLENTTLNYQFYNMIATNPYSASSAQNLSLHSIINTKCLDSLFSLKPVDSSEKSQLYLYTLSHPSNSPGFSEEISAYLNTNPIPSLSESYSTNFMGYLGSISKIVSGNSYFALESASGSSQNYRNLTFSYNIGSDTKTNKHIEIITPKKPYVSGTVNETENDSELTIESYTVIQATMVASSMVELGPETLTEDKNITICFNNLFTNSTPVKPFFTHVNGTPIATTNYFKKISSFIYEKHNTDSGDTDTITCETFATEESEPSGDYSIWVLPYIDWESANSPLNTTIFKYDKTSNEALTTVLQLPEDLTPYVQIHTDENGGNQYNFEDLIISVTLETKQEEVHGKLRNVSWMGGVHNIPVSVSGYSWHVIANNDQNETTIYFKPGNQSLILISMIYAQFDSISIRLEAFTAPPTNQLSRIMQYVPIYNTPENAANIRTLHIMFAPWSTGELNSNTYGNYVASVVSLVQNINTNLTFSSTLSFVNVLNTSTHFITNYLFYRIDNNQYSPEQKTKYDTTSYCTEFSIYPYSNFYQYYDNLYLGVEKPSNQLVPFALNIQNSVIPPYEFFTYGINISCSNTSLIKPDTSYIYHLDIVNSNLSKIITCSKSFQPTLLRNVTDFSVNFTAFKKNDTLSRSLFNIGSIVESSIPENHYLVSDGPLYFGQYNRYKYMPSVGKNKQVTLFAQTGYTIYLKELKNIPPKSFSLVMPYNGDLYIFNSDSFASIDFPNLLCALGISQCDASIEQLELITSTRLKFVANDIIMVNGFDKNSKETISRLQSYAASMVGEKIYLNYLEDLYYDPLDQISPENLVCPYGFTGVANTSNVYEPFCVANSTLR